MSKEFKTATFREIRVQPMGGANYALAVKADVFGGGQEILCFLNSEGVLRQIEEAIPSIKKEFERLRKDGAKIL